MPKASPIQTSFNAGEFSPLMQGRVDYQKYGSGLALCRNYLPTIQGPLVRRPGTIYVAETKGSGTAVLVPFEFNVEQAYIIELGDQYARFYMDNGQIVDGGSPYEISTPYLAADLADLRFAQSADTLYIAHRDYKPRKLTRSDHTDWTLETVDFIDGPYLDALSDDTEVLTGTIGGDHTVTVSKPDEINGGDGFQSTDVGRLLRLKDASGVWTWLRITSVDTNVRVTVDVLGSNPDASAPAEELRLGRWSDTTGYPAVVTFFQDRLIWGGGLPNPQALDMSVTGLYEEYTPSDPDGTVADDHAIARSLPTATGVNAIQWMLDDDKGLIVGTRGGEWLVRAAQPSQAMAPGNINAVRPTQNGSDGAIAVKVPNAVLFVQRSGRLLRELAYVFELDSFRSVPLSILAEHILASGLTHITMQDTPIATLWALNGDGRLVAMTYERSEEVVGWHQHPLGGAGDADGGEPVVESVAVIPEPEGRYDQVWLLVRRYINGATVRYVERLAKLWETGDDPELAVHLDSALTYDGAATATLSGLDHLEGETVAVLGDGAAHPEVTVSGGSVTLDREVEKAVVGLVYASIGQTLPVNAGAADGTAQGKLKRIDRVVLRVKDLLGLETGPDADNLQPVVFRTVDDALGERVPLVTEDLEAPYDGDYDRKGQFYWRQENAFPGTILAYMPQLVTQDDG